MVFAHEFRRERLQTPAQFDIILQAGISVPQFYDGLRAVTGGDAFRGLLRHLFDLGHGLHVQRPQRAKQMRFARHHVACVARVELSHGDDAGLGGRQVSGDDRLQGGDDVARGEDRVDASVGMRAVAGNAFHCDIQIAGRCVHLAGAELDIAGGNARFDVERDDRVHVRILHAAGFDHILRAAVSFFIGLEQQLYAAAERFGHAV